MQEEAIERPFDADLASEETNKMTLLAYVFTLLLEWFDSYPLIPQFLSIVSMSFLTWQLIVCLQGPKNFPRPDHVNQPSFVERQIERVKQYAARQGLLRWLFKEWLKDVRLAASVELEGHDKET